MADKDKKDDATDSGESNAEKKSGKSLATIGIFGGVMLVEAVAIFLAMKFLGSAPDPTMGMEGLTPTTQVATVSKELEVADIRVPNTNGARTILYNVKVVISVAPDREEEGKSLIEAKQFAVEDALSRIIRSSDPRYLAEPGLETLKRQIRFELNQVFGDDTIIEQVLVPDCIPLPTGF